jgi:hypothetical protein
MRDLYELGDLHRAEYVARRDAINAELSALTPAPIPDLDQARQVLEDFTIFLGVRDRPRREATVPRAYLRERVARSGPHSRRPAKVLISSLLRAAPPLSGGKNGGVKYGSDGTRTRTLPPDDIEVWRTPPLDARP